MSEPFDSSSSSDSSGANVKASGDVVVLPSGRRFDLRRSRWDGVLDPEEYEFCRRYGVGLSYDCAQIGWVTQLCIDESSEFRQLREMPANGPGGAAPDSEERALVLRSLVEREAERILADVQQGRMSQGKAREHLTLFAALSLKGFAGEFGLPDADLAHWALESATATALDSVRDPCHQRRAAPESSGFAFRPWSFDDAVVYTELLGNPRIWEYLPEPYPPEFTVDTARALIEVGAIGFHHETVAIEADGRPIGQCLLRFDRQFAGTRAAEVAYWLGEDYWGQGWMGRVLPAFTQRSFREHDVDVIYAWIMPDNEASVRAAERSGLLRAEFPLEAQLADSLRRPGFLRYATHRIDWEVAGQLP